MNIPLLDLQAQYETIREDINKAVAEVLESGHFILGPKVDGFEKETAAFCGARLGIGVASGTDALHLALRAVGVTAGDEVITTPFTFIATAEAISYAGATPVFVDIDPDTLNIDVERIEKKISRRTKAIMPVHLYGRPAEMGAIMRLARAHKLKVVEDCAQAIGAKYQERSAGSISDAGCLSFFPSKNLGGYGDGGMVVTSDEDVAARVKALRAHGSRHKYEHEIIGYNSRLDELQAAILLVKLRYLSDWNSARQKHARLYDKLLAGVENLTTPSVSDGSTHVYHLYTVRVRKGRDDVIKGLAEAGIASAVHYPTPIHRQVAYQYLGLEPGSFPRSELASKEVLSLPLYPELTEEQVKFIAETLTKIMVK